MATGKRSVVKKVSDTSEHKRSDFGAFYPMGYVVAAFPGASDAKRVRKDLLTGGYEERDVLHFEADAMAASLRRNLEGAGLMAGLGATKSSLRRQLGLAEKGCDFLLVHAPSHEEVDRVMNVVHRVPFRLAQKFHRFAIEDLK